MFNTCYPYRYIHYKPVNSGIHLRKHLYTFTAGNRLRYLVEFDEFEGNLLLVKFYQKRHSQSENKYNLLTGDGCCSAILFTTLNIMLDILKSGKFKNPCFAFMGSNTHFKDGTAESREETKRFKVYKTLIATFVGSETFRFKQNKASSIFILINKKNSDITANLTKILEYVYRNYEILDVDLIMEPFELTPQTG